MAILGVDIGGYKIKAGMVGKDGKVSKKISIFTEAEKGKRAVIRNVLAALEHLDDGNVTGIGVGIPGIVDPDGKILFTPNVPLQGAALRNALRKRYRIK